MSIDESVKKAIYRYLNLPDVLKLQIELLSDELSRDKNVEPNYNVWKRRYEHLNLDGKEILGRELRKLLLNACIFKYISALRVSEPERFKTLEVYNEFSEPVIRLHEILTEGAYVKVFKGKFIHERYSKGIGTEETVIVKLFESRDGVNTTEYEINNYRYAGNPPPSVDVNCYLWNVPVLVMKKMEKITKDDDYIEVGIQILRQLPAIHRFTTHSDLKKNNLMRDPKEKTPEGKPRYWIIDLGGCARPNERMGIGFKRRTWTKSWCVQKDKRGFTTAKHDLLELGHVLTAIRYCREHNTNKHPSQKKRTFTGRLKRYMEYVEKIDETKTPHNAYGPHYKALIEILQGAGKNKSHVSSSSKDDKRKSDKHKSDKKKSDNKKKSSYSSRTGRGFVKH